MSLFQEYLRVGGRVREVLRFMTDPSFMKSYTVPREPSDSLSELIGAYLREQVYTCVGQAEDI